MKYYVSEKNEDKIAVIEDDKKYSFYQLEKKVDAICSKLIDCGIEAQGKVGVLMRNSADFIAAIYACTKLNLISVIFTFQPNSPRLNNTINNAQPDVILVNEDFEIEFDNVINVSRLDLSEGNDSRLEWKEHQADDTAYIIYTSGSTGNPKGVVIQHKAIENYLEITLKRLLIDENSCILVTSPFSFDASLGYIYCMLSSGAALVIDQSKMLLPRIICNCLTKNNITHYACTPSLFSEISKYVLKNNIDVSNIKTFSFGAEKIYPNELELIVKLKEKYPSLLVVNRYGPTETTVAVASYVLDGSENIDIPIGTKYENNNFYLLSGDMKEVSENEVGELYISGVQVMKEYYNDKELTDKFIIEYNGEKLYKTNDLFLKKDNELFYVGRSDDMLKRNGKRVYLSEIENIVGAIKGVKDHICVKEDLDDKTFQIIAYVVVDNADSFNEGKKAVDDSFASYMLPNKYIIVDEIPKTINGKRQNILKGELK